MIRLLPPAKYSRILRYWVQNHRRKEGVFPFYASLKVTDRCRFHCSFCNVWRQPARDLDTEGMRRILRNLGNSSIILTSLEGGEPLLRSDIELLLEEAARQPFYLLFTTSERKLLNVPLDDFSRCIDFLHVSIDEGHDNLDLFEALPELVQYPWIVCVQTVVRRRDIDALAEKVRTCARIGAKILIMPAVELDDAEHDLPDPAGFRCLVVELKKQHPNVILTPRRYLDALNGESGCSAASIIIDSDGGLFYPCRTLGEKTVNLAETSLVDYLQTPEAAQRRRTMRECARQCGWYQYFAIDFFASPAEIWESLGPYWLDLLGLRRRNRNRGKRHAPLEIPQ
ncbi:MAG: radical SAM protein [bacterium]